MIWVKLKEYWARFQSDMIEGFIKMLDVSKTVIDAIHPGKSEAIGGAIIALTGLQKDWNREIDNTLKELEDLTDNLNWPKAVGLIEKIRQAMADLGDEAGETGEKVEKSLSSLVDVADKVWKEMAKKAEAAHKADLEAYKVQKEQQAEIVAKGFEDEAEKNKEMLEKMEEDWRHFSENVHDTTADTFNDIFTGVIESWQDLLDRMKDWFLRLLAELAAQAIAKPIIVPMLASMGGALGLPGMPGGGAGGMLQSLGLAGLGKKALGWLGIGGTATAGTAAMAGTAGAGAGIGAGAASAGMGGAAGIAGAAPMTFMQMTAPYLAAGGLGYMGYEMLAPMFGLPQGKYGGLGAGAGAMAGFALGGPIGAILGGLGGGIFGGSIGPKEHRPHVRANIGLAAGPEGLTNTSDVITKLRGKGDVSEWEQGLEGQINTILDQYATTVNTTLEAYNQYAGTTIRAKAFEIESMRFHTKNLEAVAEEIMDKLEQGLIEHSEALARSVGFASLEAFEEYVAKLTAASITSAELIGQAFRGALDTGDWASFEQELKGSIYNTILDGMTQAMMQSAVFQQALQPFFMSLDEAFTKAMVSGSFNVGTFWSQMQSPLGSLDSMIEGLRPAFEAMAQVTQQIQGAIGTGGSSLSIYDQLGSGIHVPSYQQGTPYVERTGLAMVHQGEKITPAADNKQPVVYIMFQDDKLRDLVRVESDGVRVEAERREMGTTPIY
jgi:hypothetical protein